MHILQSLEIEANTKDTLATVLNSEQVRNLEMDEWGWTDHFLASNSAYSGTAAEVYRKKKRS